MEFRGYLLEKTCPPLSASLLLMHNQLFSLQKSVDRNDSQEVNAEISHSERFLIKAGEQGFKKGHTLTCPCLRLSTMHRQSNARFETHSLFSCPHPVHSLTAVFVDISTGCYICTVSDV